MDAQLNHSVETIEKDETVQTPAKFVRMAGSMPYNDYMRIKMTEYRRKKGVKPRRQFSEEEINEMRKKRAAGTSLNELMWYNKIGFRKLKKLLDEDKKEVVENDVEIAVETNKEDPVTQL